MWMIFTYFMGVIEDFALGLALITRARFELSFSKLRLIKQLSTTGNILMVYIFPATSNKKKS